MGFKAVPFGNEIPREARDDGKLIRDVFFLLLHPPPLPAHLSGRALFARAAAGRHRLVYRGLYPVHKMHALVLFGIFQDLFKERAEDPADTRPAGSRARP